MMERMALEQFKAWKESVSAEVPCGAAYTWRAFVLLPCH